MWSGALLSEAANTLIKSLWYDSASGGISEKSYNNKNYIKYSLSILSLDEGVVILLGQLHVVHQLSHIL